MKPIKNGRPAWQRGLAALLIFVLTFLVTMLIGIVIGFMVDDGDSTYSLGHHPTSGPSPSSL